MIINLDEFKDFSTYVEIQRILFTKINTIINRYRNKNINFTRIIIPMNIFNFISDSSYYSSFGSYNIEDTFCYAGKLNGIDVYIDLVMKRNSIILSCSLEEIRDNKINVIINDIESKKVEIVIEVISELI